MDTAGIHPIRNYIRRWQVKISEKVSYRPISELYVETEWMRRTSRMVRWWDQDVVNEP